MVIKQEIDILQIEIAMEEMKEKEKPEKEATALNISLILDDFVSREAQIVSASPSNSQSQHQSIELIEFLKFA